MTGSDSREPRRIRQMFNGISRRYDLLNHVLSLNMDRRWRRTAAREVAAGGGRNVLDLCGGTGDLSTEIARVLPGAHVICCDFAHAMLARAGPKFARRGLAERCVTLEADGLNLPLRSGAVDAVGVAFGVRNFVDLDAGIREMHRVLAPGGRMVILEFSRPDGAVLSRLYRFYLQRILPRMGDRIAGADGPYGYLARTIGGFPDPPSLAGRVRDAGFAACGWSVLTGGIVAIHTALR